MGLAAVMVAAAANQASAATLTLGLDYHFSAMEVGTAPPASSILPWVEVEITDLSTNLVSFAIKANNLTSVEHLKDLYLNLNPAYDPTNLSFASATVAAGEFALPGIGFGTDLHQANNDGRYDMHFQFTTGDGSALHFDVGDVLTYQVSLTGGGNLTAADFNFLSAPVPGSLYGPFFAAAHVISTGPEALDSAWIAVIPEPSVATLWAISLGLALRHRR